MDQERDQERCIWEMDSETYGSNFTTPVRPEGWACEPCWHYDTAPDVILEDEKKHGKKGDEEDEA